jgi:uncharacterized protein
MQTGSDSDKRKLLSALAHGSIFISALVVSIAIPIAILFISEDSLIQDNAKEAINFHLNVWLWGILIIIPSFFTLGLFGLIWFLVHWGLSIWAVTHSLQTPDEPFRYPFIFRIV